MTFASLESVSGCREPVGGWRRGQNQGLPFLKGRKIMFFLYFCCRFGWLFSKLRTSIKIHDNHSDTGQHLQFMRCFKSVTVWKGMFSVDNVVRDPLTIFELLTPVQRGFATMGRIWLMTRRNLGRNASLLHFFPITFPNLALLLVCLIWALPTRARYHERGWVLSTLSD